MPGRGRVALRWFGRDGGQRTLTYDDLSRESSRFANLLNSVGIGEGDRIMGILPRVPETIIAMLGAFKAGAVYLPVFTGFGAEAIAFRLTDSGARAIVTHHAFRDRLPDPIVGAETVITVAAADGAGLGPGDLAFAAAMADQADAYTPCQRPRDATAVILYTSGSTGQPKGVRIAGNYLAAVWPYLRYGLDLQPGDVYWPTGDPGWGYGLICYMVAMAMGVPVISCERDPAVDFVLPFLVQERVTNLATVPTLLRGIMALGAEEVGRHDVALRCIGSVGEPLNSEVVDFFRKVWGVTPLDAYGSSESGMPIGNFRAVDMTVKPGSMGRPAPGSEMAIVDDAGRPVPAGSVGHIGLKRSAEGYYSLGYWNNPEMPDGELRGEWLMSGDLGRQDDDGYFWFEGRADDVINSAGYRIGPFEVESAILHHPAVAEAAVVGQPDSLRGEIVAAYVILKPGEAARPGLDGEIVETVKRVLGRHQQPRRDHLRRQPAQDRNRQDPALPPARVTPNRRTPCRSTILSIPTATGPTAPPSRRPCAPATCSTSPAPRRPTRTGRSSASAISPSRPGRSSGSSRRCWRPPAAPSTTSSRPPTIS